MSLLYSTLLLLGLVLAILLPIALSQFDKPKNANKFVDSVSPTPSHPQSEFTMVAPPDDRASGEREQRDDPAGGRTVPRGRRPARLPPRVGLAGGDHDSYTRSSGTATTLTGTAAL